VQPTHVLGTTQERAHQPARKSKATQSEANEIRSCLFVSLIQKIVWNPNGRQLGTPFDIPFSVLPLWLCSCHRFTMFLARQSYVQLQSVPSTAQSRGSRRRQSFRNLSTRYFVKDVNNIRFRAFKDVRKALISWAAV
jgi:hypothetical protein